ncbi:hypothetical protein [Scytonema sp. PCC 10023]|uniref:hypothetical protein n=1 Tax=Scytonema sp. PCC 10023 TaxID=1680591 RepID=UPI0039C724AE
MWTIAVKPAYTSQLLAYRDEFVFIDCGIREYWDEKESLWVDRDVNASINIKRVGLGLFPTIKCRKANPVVGDSTTNSTSFAQRLPLGEGSSGSSQERQKPTPTASGGVGSSLPSCVSYNHMMFSSASLQGGVTRNLGY